VEQPLFQLSTERGKYRTGTNDDGKREREGGTFPLSSSSPNFFLFLFFGVGYQKNWPFVLRTKWNEEEETLVLFCFTRMGEEKSAEELDTLFGMVRGMRLCTALCLLACLFYGRCALNRVVFEGFKFIHCDVCPKMLYKITACKIVPKSLNTSTFGHPLNKTAFIGPGGHSRAKFTTIARQKETDCCCLVIVIRSF
jgi:hypothetical protein